MLKRIILGTLCLGVFSTTTNAIDVNIPGADPNIPKNAYENYRKNGAEAKLMEREITELLTNHRPQNIVDTKDSEIDVPLYSSIELNHSQDFSSSVFILKERGADLKYTMPVTSRFSTVELGKIGSRLIERSFIYSNKSGMGYSLEIQPVSNNWKTTKIPYSELTAEQMTDLAKKGMPEAFENGKTFKVGVFSYPTIEKGTWQFNSTNNRSAAGTISFTMKETPSIEYTIGYQFNVYDKPKPFKDEQTLMKELLSPVVNYALPSIEPASQVLSKSKSFAIGQFVFQTMPTSQFVKEGDESQYQYIYEGKDYREGIIVTPMDANDKAHKNKIFTKAIRSMILNKQYSGYKPIQFATVWNDTIPSAYMEVERHKDKVFMQITYDDTNVYSHFIISYPSNSVSDKDMRDIIQYVKNTKETYNEKREGIGAKNINELVGRME